MARILIADDEPGILKLMATILAKAGHSVETCSSGAAALQKLGIAPDDSSVEPPDLIVLDIMMPKMDGYEIGNLVRRNPRTRIIPILAVTALRELSRVFTATVQVQGFLSKPFGPKELVSSVENILAGSKAA